MRLVMLVAVAGLALGWRGEGGAQPSTAPEALIQRGIELRRQGKDFEAFEYFKKAHDLAPTPRAKAQLGLVEQALSRWTDAEVHLEAALQARRDPWIQRNQAILEQSLRTVRAHVGLLDVQGAPEGAELTINGKPAGRLPLAAPVRVGEGYAEVELGAPGHVTAKRTVTVRGGHTVPLFIKLDPEPVPAAPPPAEPPAPAAALHPEGMVEPVGPRSGPRTAILGAGAAGVLGIAAGIWMGVRVQSLERQTERAYAAGDDHGASELEQRGRRTETLQWIGYGTGATALAASALLYYFGIRNGQTPRRAAVLLPGGVMAAVAAEF